MRNCACAARWARILLAFCLVTTSAEGQSQETDPQDDPADGRSFLGLSADSEAAAATNGRTIAGCEPSTLPVGKASGIGPAAPFAGAER